MSKPKINIEQGDITVYRAAAIVNAANSSLLGGGGVDGAIHRAAGAQLLEECREIRSASLPNGLPTGEAVITKGYDLPAQYVIHTVGPVFNRNPIEKLADCYLNSLKLAEENNCSAIAFPAISTGIYGVPVELSAQIVSDVLSKYSSEVIKEIYLVLFSSADLEIYNKAFAHES